MINKNTKEPKTDADIALGYKIRTLITLKGLTNGDIARDAGVTSSAIAQTIWGKRRNPVLRKAIAKALGFKSWEELKKDGEDE